MLAWPVNTCHLEACWQKGSTRHPMVVWDQVLLLKRNQKMVEDSGQYYAHFWNYMNALFLSYYVSNMLAYSVIFSQFAERWRKKHHLSTKYILQSKHLQQKKSSCSSKVWLYAALACRHSSCWSDSVTFCAPCFLEVFFFLMKRDGLANANPLKDEPWQILSISWNKGGALISSHHLISSCESWWSFSD